MDQAPCVVRIKRKWDAPSLPGFTLGQPASKRPAFEGLSLDSKPSRRFRLVATQTEWGENATMPGSQGSGSQSEQRKQQQRKQRQEQQGAARYRRVTSLRNESADGESSMLVLERCEVPKPALVPFGEPLPPAERPSPTTQKLAGWRSCPNNNDLPSCWQDALAAVEEEQRQHQLQAAEASEDSCVFDVYEELRDRTDVGPLEGVFEQELCWDDAEDDLFDDDGGSAADSDSNGEVDYPDEEGESDEGSDADA